MTIFMEEYPHIDEKYTPHKNRGGFFRYKTHSHKNCTPQELLIQNIIPIFEKATP